MACRPPSALPLPLLLCACVLHAAENGGSSGLAGDSLGVNMHKHGSPEQLAMVARAGISIVRTDISWAEMSPAGGYNFSSTDVYVASLQAAGLRLLAIMDATNAMFDGGHPVRSAAAIEAYGHWVGNFTARYSAQTAAGMVLLEITNEPNGGGGYKHNATAYSLLVAAAATAAHSAVPTAQIVGPATECIDLAWMTQVFEGGALQHFDQITVHPYRPDAPETALADLAAVHAVVAEFAPPGRVVPVQV